MSSKNQINNFLSKGQTLKNIKIKNLIIPKIFLFKVNEFKLKKNYFVKQIQNKFKNKIIIRSSNFIEDGKSDSFAGYFESVLNVDSQNSKEIISSIEKVINSYKNYNSKKNEILIQPMIQNTNISGVITTCDLKNASPYYVIDINYGKDTTAVTSGKKNTKQIIIPRSRKSLNNPYKKIIWLADKLEKKFNNSYLDIEFAIKKNKIYLFQVRPISKKIINSTKNKLTEKDLEISLKKIEKKIIKLQKKHPNLLGDTTFFGVMPDWNPAEIIGVKPKPLALSMYQELVTDYVWAESRKKFGFRDVTSNHLMTNFYGTPFIDVRVDFNSWLPNDLNKVTSNKLIKFYLKKFKSNLNYHDKVEFKIIFSCFTPSTDLKLKQLKKNNFHKNEIQQIRKKLIKINNLAFTEIKTLINNLDTLKKKQEELNKSKMYPIDKAYWLLEDCKKYGTYSFAGLARCGFIAIEIINDLVKEKIFSENDKNEYLKSIKTITSDLIIEKIKLNKKEFLNKYGHLRPNTYEISSKNYFEGYDEYFVNKDKVHLKKNNKFKFSKKQTSSINKFLKKNFKNINIKKLDNFLKQSIYYREYGKFIFTKSIDLIFNEIKKISIKNNISNYRQSFLEINDIKNLYYNLDNENIKNLLNKKINQNIKKYIYNRNIRLPEVITSANDIYYFEEKIGKINFVTNNAVIGKIKKLNKNNLKKLNNLIIVIESADPGYDFIFDQNIKGLITKYGGANSHMSIRCSELGIPAAIGVGNNLFESLKDNNLIELDCDQNKINFI